MAMLSLQRQKRAWSDRAGNVGKWFDIGCM